MNATRDVKNLIAAQIAIEFSYHTITDAKICRIVFFPVILHPAALFFYLILQESDIRKHSQRSQD